MDLRLIAVVLLAGCGSTQRAQTHTQSAYIGQQATAFFAANGLPYAQMDTPDGTIYEWQSGTRSVPMPATTTATSTVIAGQVQTTAITTGGGAANLFCRARILTDKSGRITSFSITTDTVGAWKLSRCAEVLK